jgi:hypothetical protein
MDADLGIKLLEVLSPILMAALTWVAAKVAQLISAKVKAEWVRGVLIRLDDAVLNAVREVQQAVVNEIKAGRADGKLTAEERAQVKARAIQSIRSRLGVRGLGELARVLGLEDGCLEKLLSTRVEAAVHDLRRSMMNGVPNGHGPNGGSAVPFVPPR